MTAAVLNFTQNLKEKARMGCKEQNGSTYSIVWNVESLLQLNSWLLPHNPWCMLGFTQTKSKRMYAPDIDIDIYHLPQLAAIALHQVLTFFWSSK